MKRTKKRTPAEDAAAIKQLDNIPAGSTVYVSYAQSGLVICVIRGKWVPRNESRVFWQVDGLREASGALISPLDTVTVTRQKGKQYDIRVDLSGRRHPNTKTSFRRARLAGWVTEDTGAKQDPEHGGAA